MQYTAGLTLLELLITIAILVLLIAIGGPTISAVQKNIQLRGAAQTSYFAFQHARSSAITQGNDITVAIASGEHWCAALSDHGLCNCKVDNHCTLNGVEHKIHHADFRFVTMDGVSFGKDSVAIFDGDRGLAIGHAGTVIFSDGDKKLKLILSNMGRVRICSIGSALGGYAPC